jgi:hypothetical protein
MATAHDSRIKALVGLDAVLTGGMPGSDEQLSFDPQQEGHLITQPAGFLLSPPQTCNNNQDNGLFTYDYINSNYKAKYQLVNGSHCDFMDASEFPNTFCFTICGGEYNEERLRISRKYLTAWMLFFLQNNNEAYSYLFDQQLQADINANYLENVGYSIPSQPSSSPNDCLEGDANNDGQINSADLKFLLTNYPHLPTSQCTDQNKDGILNLLDYALVLVKL